MREIIFRGKRLDGEGWAHGDLSQHKSGKIFIKPGNATRSLEVIPGSVGQYTGLTDKNGKRIFEGDIFACPGRPKFKYTVSWEGGGFTIFTDCFGFDPAEIEIIGNIHEGAKA